MFISKLFEQVAMLKYPLGYLDGLRLPMKCEIYEAFTNAVERGLLQQHDTVEQLAIHVATMKLQDAGGKKWSPEDAAHEVQQIADSLIEHACCFSRSEFDHPQSPCYDVSKH